MSAAANAEVGFHASTSSARSASGRVAADGSVLLPPIRLPFSDYASSEARSAFSTRFAAIEPPPEATRKTIDALREHYDSFNRGCLAPIAAKYAHSTTSDRIGDVDVQFVEPEGGAARTDKLLICLHGGGFLWGAGAGALVEAAPIAAVSGLRVAAVQYRLAPEHRFPAASDDVVALYRAFLDAYRPQDIGIYGSSAGALLTAQTVAALDEAGLPLPAAVGTFFAATNEIISDSLWLATPSLGQEPWTHDRVFENLPYFEGADMKSPRVLPANSDALIARFPPTLVATATRDFAMSACVTAHRQLVQCGVAAELHVWDGLWHAFPVDCSLPEAVDFYRVVSGFFRRRLGL